MFVKCLGTYLMLTNLVKIYISLIQFIYGLFTYTIYGASFYMLYLPALLNCSISTALIYD